MRKKRDGKETQYFLQGECKVFRKKTTHVCSYCADINTVKIKFWYITLRQTVPVLHSMCIEHTNVSDKYIIIKPFFKYIFYAINAALLLIQV